LAGIHRIDGHLQRLRTQANELLRPVSRRTGRTRALASQGASGAEEREAGRTWMTTLAALLKQRRELIEKRQQQAAKMTK